MDEEDFNFDFDRYVDDYDRYYYDDNDDDYINDSDHEDDY